MSQTVTTPTSGVNLAALPEVGRRAVAKMRWRILPVVIIFYFLAYLDRNNVGWVPVSTMQKDLNLTTTAVGLAAGVFFIGYCLFEFPSNAGMARFGARVWISRILIPWGIIAACMSLVRSDGWFLTLRILLGVAEAGFFPAVVFYFTLWFPARQRAAILGMFYLAQPAANALGSLMSGAIITNLDKVWGMHGWQWMFIIEGVPAVIAGLLAPMLLTDKPADAKWLQADEKQWVTTTIAAEGASKTLHGDHPFLSALKDWRVYVYALLLFTVTLGNYGFGLWLPAIIKGMLGASASAQQVGLIAFIPYGLAAIFLFFFTKNADRTGKRALHTGIGMGMAAVGVVCGGLLMNQHAFVPALAFFCIAAMGVYSGNATMLTMPSSLFAGVAAAGAIGFINAFGNIGGFLGPYIRGWLKDATGSDVTNMLFLGAVLIIGAVGTYLFAHNRPEGNTACDPVVVAQSASAEA